MSSSPPSPIMLRQLRKRPVVDIGTAETVGRVRSVRIDPTEARVVGIVLRGGEGGLVPMDEVQAIGQDAVTIQAASVVVGDEEVLPADTDAYGSRVLDEDGNELGKLSDLSIAEDGTIVGVVIGEELHDRRLMGIGSYAVVVGRTGPRSEPAAHDPVG